MRKLLLSILILIVSVAFIALAGDNAYVGIKKCSMCHKKEANGMIYEKWQSGPHAKAYAQLASDKSHEVYTSLGKSGNPQEDPECLKCHVTGFGVDAALGEKLLKEDGVTCEACHNAGGSYWKKTIMEDHDAAIANGLNPDPKAGCVTCHNEESPTYKDFNIEERWAEIEHRRPE